MKALIKKVTAICLTIVCIMTVSVTAMAADYTEGTINNIETFENVADSTIVGKMYVCTQQVGLGHAWIYIENYTDYDIPVGCYTLQPGRGVSVGTFCLTRSDGPGVYYNIEAYCQNHYGLSNQSWMGTEITKKQLKEVCQAIKTGNYWDPYFNCTFLASRLWNKTSGKALIPLMFPFITKWQILIHDGTKDIIMNEVDETECFKQVGSGKNAYLRQVRPGSLDSKLL